MTTETTTLPAGALPASNASSAAEAHEPVLIVDAAESSSQIDKHLVSLGIPIVKERLEIGDFNLDGQILVERKRTDDFVNSLMDGRLFSQASMMKASGMRSMFLIEGDMRDIQSNVNPEALAGAQSALVVFYDTSMVFTGGQLESARLIGRMFLHLTKGLGYEIPLRNKKPKDLQVMAQYLVEGLPGVGVESARKLLRHFGSARAVFAATEAELVAVDGMGKKGAQKLLEALNAPVGGACGMGGDFHSTKAAPKRR